MPHDAHRPVDNVTGVILLILVVLLVALQFWTPTFLHL